MPTIIDLNTAGQQADYFRDLIENGCPEGERSEKFQEVVWHLATQGWTIEQIVDELAKYPNGIGLEVRQPSVGRSHALVLQVAEPSARGCDGNQCYRNWCCGSGRSNHTPWPQIKVIPGELPRVVNEAEDALILLDREIYQRNGMVVRPVLNKSLKASDGSKTESWQLVPVTRPHLVETLCCAAQFLRYDKRAKKFVPIDAPDKVAEAYLNRQGHWKLPHLIGVVNAPFVRVDGSICETAGYDPDSYVLFKPETQIFPPVPQISQQGRRAVLRSRNCAS